MIPPEDYFYTFVLLLYNRSIKIMNILNSGRFSTAYRHFDIFPTVTLANAHRADNIGNGEEKMRVSSSSRNDARSFRSCLVFAPRGHALVGENCGACSEGIYA